jgi:hypothetical protein
VAAEVNEVMGAEVNEVDKFQTEIGKKVGLLD